MKTFRPALLFIVYVFFAGNLSAQSIIPDDLAFGKPTRGGHKGRIIRVTNLEESGPGSLREAVISRGPRIVVFEVAGVIDLDRKRLSINEPYLTIAGQTAPSPGITIIKGGISITTHDVIIKHIAVRPGDAGQPRKSGWEPDGLTTSGGDAHDIIIDHCSFTWAVDENLSVSGTRTEGPDSTSHRVTFSNNIIAECLDNSSHSKGPHSKGTLIHDFCRDIAIVGNLYAHNAQRNPYFKAYTTGAIVNNLIYNPGDRIIHLGYWAPEWKDARYEPENCRVSIVGNLLHKGKDTKPGLAMIAPEGDAFMEDNAAFDRSDKPSPLTGGQINALKRKPVWPGKFKAFPLEQVEAYVLQNAGARPADRDPIDQRIVQSCIERSGGIIDSQEEVEGYPLYHPNYRKLKIPDKDIEQWLDEMAAALE